MEWKETVIQEIFERRFPAILLGSGASISTSQSLNLTARFPSMADLAKRYLDNIIATKFKPEDQAAYRALTEQFEALGDEWYRFNLEGFLTDYPLRHDSDFLQQILEETTDAFKIPHEELSGVFEKNPNTSFPLKDMIIKLLRAAPAANPELCIITPNYDLLVEYSADLIGVPCLTGFSGGILRQWKPEIGSLSPMLKQGGKIKPAKCLRLIKPHGSFAWHQSKANLDNVIECFQTEGLRGDWQRCMIVPGPTKYAEALRDVRREHLHFMDHAFKAASSLLIIGYGFNDPHLEAHLRRSLESGTPALCVTYSLSDDVRERFVSPFANVTCITSDGESGSLVQIGGEVTHYPDDDFWKLERFVSDFIR